jgi:hypothetical protein
VSHIAKPFPGAWYADADRPSAPSAAKMLAHGRMTQTVRTAIAECEARNGHKPTAVVVNGEQWKVLAFYGGGDVRVDGVPVIDVGQLADDDDTDTVLWLAG